MSTDRLPALVTFVFDCPHAHYAEAREQGGITVCDHCSKPLFRRSNPPPKEKTK